MLISDNSLTVAINTKDISMVRGNSDCLEIRLKENGSPVPLETGDVITFSVKKREEDTEYVLQKKITSFEFGGVAVIDFKPEDTIDIPAGDYVYDIRLDYDNGDVITLMETSNFVLRGVVTHD